jgi:hypothetical protein
MRLGRRYYLQQWDWVEDITFNNETGYKILPSTMRLGERYYVQQWDWVEDITFNNEIRWKILPSTMRLGTIYYLQQWNWVEAITFNNEIGWKILPSTLCLGWKILQHCASSLFGLMPYTADGGVAVCRKGLNSFRTKRASFRSKEPSNREDQRVDDHKWKEHQCRRFELHPRHPNAVLITARGCKSLYSTVGRGTWRQKEFYLSDTTPRSTDCLLFHVDLVLNHMG